MKKGFWDKLIDRMDRLDSASLQTQFLRLARERGFLETVFQSIQEGVLVIDGGGLLSYANKAAERLMGFSFETAKGRSVSRFLREIDWDKILTMDETAWSKVINREIEITYPEHRFVNFYIVPLQSESVGVPGKSESDSKDDLSVVVILNDVTHARDREATVLESERLNAVKLLAAGVAHEIGNPLNAMNIHLQLLDREISSLLSGCADTGDDQQDVTKSICKGDVENLSELVGVARNEVSRLDLIITQFLHAVRPAKPDFVLSDMEVILKESLTLMKQEIENRTIEVELDCMKKVPKVWVDANQIKQVVFNITKNAFQAMPDGGALTISLSSSHEFVAIEFKDTGEGIRSEDFGQIFEPYHTTKVKGSGLGLMIVQRIIQDHGGQLEVASKPGEGSSFTVSLPIGQRKARLLQAEKPAG